MEEDWDAIETVMCAGCEHWKAVKGQACAAFPDGIPSEIINGHFDHRKPHVGDHGIQFRPIPK